MSPFFTKKLDGYSRRFRHEYAMWSHRRRKSENQRRYEAWTRHLLEKPPDVLVGPDLSYGGVRGHVRAIKRYSSFNITLVPDEHAMGGLDRFTGECRERFMGFNPAGRPVVHSHVIPWMIQWCRSQQQRGLRWVHTYHLPYFPEHGREGLKPDQIEINDALIHEACFADVRLSVSRWQQGYLLAEYGIQTDYLPNGVDVEACDRGDEDRFRRQTGLQGPFVLYVGRNDPVKNPAEFVRLAQAMPDLQFAIMGQWLDQNVMRKDWGLESPENLHYLGAASHGEVQDALAACSALVVTSKREGMPTLVLEAMSHGKPIVVPDEAGCMEAIGDGECGFIYRLGNIPDLVEMTHAALSDRERCSRARTRVLQEYDWRVVAVRLDEIYHGTR